MGAAPPAGRLSFGFFRRPVAGGRADPQREAAEMFDQEDRTVVPLIGKIGIKAE